MLFRSAVLRLKKLGPTEIQILGIKNRDGEDAKIRVGLNFGPKVTYEVLPDDTAEKLAERKAEYTDRVQSVREMKNAGMTQREIAEALGVSQARISQLLRAKI